VAGWPAFSARELASFRSPNAVLAPHAPPLYCSPQACLTTPTLTADDPGCARTRSALLTLSNISPIPLPACAPLLGAMAAVAPQNGESDWKANLALPAKDGRYKTEVRLM
jgi:hypothetical protein